MNIFLVMVGGALGAAGRYGLGLFFMRNIPNPPIPVAMIIVNSLGSLGLGLFFGHYFSSGEGFQLYEARSFLLIGVGFFGAFTTFSTFSVEAVQLLRDQKLKKACFYVLLTIIFSIFSFSAGFLLII